MPEGVAGGETGKVQDVLNQPRNGTYFRLRLDVTEQYGGNTAPSISTSSSLCPNSHVSLMSLFFYAIPLFIHMIALSDCTSHTSDDFQ